jgi:uncharacterized membrane protein
MDGQRPERRRPRGAEERRGSPRGIGAALAALLLAPLLPLAACSHRPAPAVPAAATPEEPAPAAPAAQEPAPPAPPTTVVIDPGGAPSPPPTLLEASAAAKRKRQAAPPPVAVIDDDNLAEYAQRGKLTYASPAAPPAGEGAETAPEGGQAAAGGEGGGEGATPAAGAAAAAEPAVKGEAYWRDNVRKLRQEWREARDQIDELSQRAEGLRRQFYSEDDPYVRDGQIKPAWDRVLDRLEQARLDVEARRAELQAFLAEGRRSGALPGWLREGIELEPEPRAPDGDLPALEPQEPTVMEPGEPPP